ncbi:LysR family transcriptional regulator [Aquabacterium sp.]|uniref:LysR family transcriptional regulator n=1 Tax=Aquabacterium sp. TaxID=1872578 RepID=UPI0037839184
MAKLDVDWLQLFVELYRTQSVSRAAERLGIAQASASIALNKLRAHFGDPLFSRTSRGMEPTPHAQALYPELLDIVERLDRARGAVARFDAATAQRRFCICMTDISEIVLLPSLMNRLRQVAPGIVIEAEKIGADSQRRLESGDVDLAVGFMPQLEAGFYQQTLFQQNFVCLVARKHPRIGDKLTRRAFTAEAHILVGTSGTGHAIVDKVLNKAGVKRHVALHLPSYLGVARIVAQTELLVIVPRLLGETLALQEPVRLLPPPVALPSYAVKQHWHERFNRDAGNVWLRRCVAEVMTGSRA